MRSFLKSTLVQNVGLVVAALLLIALTGGNRSPLEFVIYFPILLAAIRDGMRQALGISLVLAALCLAGAYAQRPAAVPDPRVFGIALSFPTIALFMGLLSKHTVGRYEALQSRASELSALLDMSQMMDSAFDLEMTLNLVLLNVQKLTGCDVCAVYLKDASGENVELRAASGPRDWPPLLTSLPIAQACCCEWSIDGPAQLGQTTPAFYLPDTAHPQGAPSSRLFDLDRRARSFACVPLTSIEGLLGMLYIGYDRPRGLAAGGVERLEHLAIRAAFSLQRVMLQHGFQSLAYSDPMTGLDNFRRFDQNLTEEMRRAERYGHKLSVILLDIDHFKGFNDTLGHQAGDALLGQLGVVLRNTLRSVDKPARYGGEEFVIICPETGGEEARLIAERLRRTIADTAFALLEKSSEMGGAGENATRHVTVSIGFATYPQDSQNARDLVKKADTALYAAKAAGRNTVRGHDDVSNPMVMA